MKRIYTFPFIDVRRELKQHSSMQYTSILYLKMLQEKNWKYMRMGAYLQVVR
jgi:hypothetical protein